jgi:hypothetical protein
MDAAHEVGDSIDVIGLRHVVGKAIDSEETAAKTAMNDHEPLS